MWLMLQQEKADDFVISSGRCSTVRQFVELAFREIGVQIEWQGTLTEEKGLDAKTGRILVEVDSKYFRPTEVDVLLGDSSKARRVLGWEPKTSLEELVRLMVQYDCNNNDFGGRE